MIEVNHLSFSYGSKSPSVLSDFDLRLADGCICGLLGENGVGKSTLLYLLCGMLFADQGSVLVDGVEARERQPEMLRHLYLVPEELMLPNISLASYLDLHRDVYPRFDATVFQSCTEAFGVDTDKRLATLSMGQRKKIAISFALASGARHILMDEPTNGLDIPSKKVFRQLVTQLMTEEQMLIISTHQVHDIESIVDHVVIMDQCRTLVNHSVSEITDRFAFELLPSTNAAPEVLYAEPALGGQMAVVQRTPESEETKLWLELFFNAVISGHVEMPASQQKDTYSANV